MIQTNDLLQGFYNAVDLLPEQEKHNGVFFGEISITDKAGLEAILVLYTQYIDKLLQTLPLSPAQYIELVMCRCFTFDEYCMLWDKTVKIRDGHMIFKVLLIQTEKDRFLFSSVREATHEDFVQFLKVYTGCNNSFIHNFIYEIYN